MKVSSCVKLVSRAVRDQIKVYLLQMIQHSSPFGIGKHNTPCYVEGRRGGLRRPPQHMGSQKGDLDWLRYSWSGARLASSKLQLQRPTLLSHIRALILDTRALTDDDASALRARLNPARAYRGPERRRGCSPNRLRALHTVTSCLLVWDV